MTRTQLIFRLATTVAVAVAVALTISLPAGAATRPHPKATHMGMTWHVRNALAQGSDHLVNVGADDVTNAYAGDTPASASLPVLCLYEDDSPPPTGITLDIYNGWARGWVASTPAVSGRKLTSLTAADGICVKTFGTGWRMAEHHDGWLAGQPTLGWHFWARGVLPVQQGLRFWVYINDQPANCWNSAVTAPATHHRSS